MKGIFLIFLVSSIIVPTLSEETKENIKTEYPSKLDPITNLQNTSDYMQPIPLMIDLAILIEKYLGYGYNFIRSREPYNVITFYFIFSIILWKFLKGNKQVSYVTHSNKVIDKRTQETVIKVLEERNRAIEKELLAIKTQIKPPNVTANVEPTVNLVPGINKILDEIREIENTHREFEEEISESHKEILEELQYLSMETLRAPTPESAGPDSHMPSDEEI